jgi:hypothetical protein
VFWRTILLAPPPLLQALSDDTLVARIHRFIIDTAPEVFRQISLLDMAARILVRILIAAPIP